jgi:small subunit ribosomal protein S18
MNFDRRDISPDRDERISDEDRARGRALRRRKVCRFCTEKDAAICYYDVQSLRSFVSEWGKIVPRRISGNCAKHQREMALAVKRARVLSLTPYVISA